MNPNKNVAILVADDEKGIRDLLTYALSAQGYRVATASNGEEALAQVKKSKFQLAICDVRMPKLGGIECLEALKKADPDLEVIMATGYATVETAVAAMKKGAYDFVQKPFQLEEIFALIEKALEKSGLKADLAAYEASKAVFKSTKLDALLPVIIKLAQQMLKADDVSIMLLWENHLEVAATYGLDSQEKLQARLALGERVAGKAAALKEPILITGPLEGDPRFSGISSLREIRSSIVCPLLIEGEVLGVMNASRTLHPEPFAASDLRSMVILSSQISQAVYNARLFKQVEDKVKELEKAYARLEQAHQQIMQSEKMAAIGQLAAGVAHELNNPLTGILGFSQILLQCQDLSPQQKEDLEGIYKQSQRCRAIIQNLLHFARRRESKKEPVDVIPLLNETLQLIRYDFSNSGIEIAEDIPRSLPPVLADSSQLQQVFLNLITNARHAMEEKRPAILKIRARCENGRVWVSFSDTGCGIPKESMGKIFDPFFTTKPLGKGTGLGLPISYGILQQHQGGIRVESQEGAGTTFTIELPLLDGNAHEPKENPSHRG